MSAPQAGKKSRKWLWIIGVIAALAIFGSFVDTSEVGSDTDEPPAPTTSTSAIASPEPSTEASPEPEQEPEAPTVSVGKEYEAWALDRYDGMTWSEIGSTYGGWESNVRDVDSNDDGDTLIFVTNLSRDNPVGMDRAEAIVNAVKNQAQLEPDIPERVRDELRYVQVYDLQGNLLASGGVDFD